MSLYFYLPLWGGSNDTSQSLSVSTMQDEIFDAIDKAEKGKSNEEEEGRYRGYRNRNENKFLDDLNEKFGYLSILSCNHSIYRPKMSDFTVTRYADRHSPGLAFAAMKPEIFPFAFLRIFGSVKDGKIRIIDYEFRHVSVMNVSMGGGSGDNLIETLQIAFDVLVYRYIELDLATRAIVHSSTAHWDTITGVGAREGPAPFMSLAHMCRQTVMKHISFYEKKDLVNLQKLKLLPAEELQLSSLMFCPPGGRRVYVSLLGDDASKRRVARQVRVEELTRSSLLAAISRKFHTPVDKIVGVYFADSSSTPGCLIELENDDDVEEYVVDKVRLEVSLAE